MAIMTAQQFINKAKQIQKTNTVYMWGTYGKPLTVALINSKATQYPKYNTPARVARHKALVGKGYTAWDCVGLIKGILWGWEPGKDVPYRGNTLVPDTGSDGMIKLCTNQSTDFRTIVPGSVVWKTGHIGIYIGNGLIVEATSAWTDNVLISYLGNLGKVTGYPGRDTWTRHGRLPWIDYSGESAYEPIPEVPVGKDYILHKVKKGDTPWGLAVKYYGNGAKYVDILAYNNMKPTASLYVWQTLKIPVKQQPPTTPPTEQPKPVEPVTPLPETFIIHKVKKGDTPWGLAERYLDDGRKYKTILKFNNLPETANIFVGQELKIPYGQHQIHTVQKGDTPWGLAVKYLGAGIRYPEIMDLNGLSADSHIKVGQRLLIPLK